MRDPDARYHNDSRFRIDLDFGDRRCTTEGWGWTNGGAFVFSRRCRRLVRARRPQGSILLFGQPDGLDKADTLLRILRIKNTAIREGQPLTRNLEFCGNGRAQHLPRAFGGLDGGIAGHQSHAAGVAAEIDRSEVGVARHNAYVEGINSQHLGDDIRQDRIGTLTNFRRPAKDGYEAATIQFQLHAGLRHLVVVDWSLGSGHVSAARDPDSLAVRQLSELVFPTRARHDFIDALAQSECTDANPIRRYRVGRNEVLFAHLCRIDSQMIGNLVQLDLLGPTWLGVPWPRFGPQGA